MPMQVSYIRNEDRLDLSFSGNLDISLSQDICDSGLSTLVEL
jgi:hypothetical protein